MLGDDAAAAAQATLHRIGWNSRINPVWRTAADAASAGVGVAARRFVGICPHPQFVAPEYLHRIGAAWIGGLTRGGVHVITVYLYDSEGASERNLELLRQLAGTYCLA